MINMISSTRRGKDFEIAINSVLLGCEQGGCVRSEHSKEWLKYQLAWCATEEKRKDLQTWWARERDVTHREDAEWHFERIIWSADRKARKDIVATLKVLQKYLDHELVAKFHEIIGSVPEPSVEWVKSSVTNSSVEFL